MRGICGATVLVLMLTSASLGLANPQADELFGKARAAEQAGRYEEACAKFTQVVQLDPSAVGAMLNLGECHDKLHQLVEALKWYSDARNLAERYNQHEYEQAINEAVHDLEQRIPVIAFEFASPLPQNGDIVVDGKPISLETSARYRVDAGQHTVEVRAPGKQTVTDTFTLAEAGQHTVHVAFDVDRAAVVPGHNRRLLAYGLGGAAILLFAGDVTAGLVYKSAYDNYCSTGSNGMETCTITSSFNGRIIANNLDSAAKIWTTGLFAAGVVATGLAVYLYLTPPKLESPPQHALIPTVGPDGAGFALIGRF